MFLKEGPQAIKFLMRQGLKFILVFWPDYYSNVPGAHEYGRSLMCELFNINELATGRTRSAASTAFHRCR